MCRLGTVVHQDIRQGRWCSDEIQSSSKAGRACHGQQGPKPRFSVPKVPIVKDGIELLKPDVSSVPPLVWMPLPATVATAELGDSVLLPPRSKCWPSKRPAGVIVFTRF